MHVLLHHTLMTALRNNEILKTVLLTLWKTRNRAQGRNIKTVRAWGDLWLLTYTRSRMYRYKAILSIVGFRTQRTCLRTYLWEVMTLAWWEYKSFLWRILAIEGQKTQVQTWTKPTPEQSRDTEHEQNREYDGVERTDPDLPCIRPPASRWRWWERRSGQFGSRVVVWGCVEKGCL